jgi:hypothetical protein
MTKKDYVLIASTLHLAAAYMQRAQARDVIDHACRLLKNENPRFDEAKFRAECARPMAFVRAILKEQR